MNNSGLFATHYLVDGARQTPQWAVAAAEAAPWLGLRGEKLISAMGFTARRAANAAHILTTKDSNEPRAAPVLLSEEESFDSASPRFAVSPVSFGLETHRSSAFARCAKREGPAPFVVRATAIAVFPTPPVRSPHCEV